MSGYTRELTDFATDRGWNITQRANNHLCLKHPQIPHPVFASATPSDYRSISNAKAQCKRLEREFGVVVPDVRQARKGGRVPMEEFEVSFGPEAITYTIKCSECGQTATSDQRHESVAPMMSNIAQRFRLRGWHVKMKRHDDLCPDCIAKREQKTEPPVAFPPTQIQVQAQEMELPILPALAQPLAIEPPREKPSLDRIAVDGLARQTRAQKRKIIALLSKVYVDEIGYMPGESDETVARKAGAVRELVEIVRREFYGPLQKGPKAALKREILAYRAEMSAFEREMMERLAKIEARGLALMKWLDQIDESAIPGDQEPELPLNGHKVEAA